MAIKKAKLDCKEKIKAEVEKGLSSEELQVLKSQYKSERNAIISENEKLIKVVYMIKNIAIKNILIN